jgi:putative excisionase
MAIENKFITIKEVAEYLGYSVGYLYKLVSKKEIPFYQPTGSKILFDKNEIEKWVKKNKCHETQRR